MPVDGILRLKMMRKALPGDETQFSERAIEGRDIMSFGEEQIVPFRVLHRIGTDTEHVFVEVHEEICAREGGANETSAVGRHPDDVLPDAQGE
jgi:hypothetical protein